MRRRSAAAVSTTTPRSDSNSAIRCSSSSDGESSPRAIARSALASPRAMKGSTGHRTNRLTSVVEKVRTPHGSRMKQYSTVRQATGSFRVAHRRGNIPPLRCIPDNVLGSSIRTPSSARVRARSALPSPRAPMRPRASSGRPMTVTDNSTPLKISNVT